MKKYKTPFFFSAKCLQDRNIISTVELRRVFRQEDKKFIELLDHIRTTANLEQALKEINKRIITAPLRNEYPVILTPRNDTADRINGERLNKLGGVIKEFVATADGVFHVEKTWLPSPQKLRLKVGARVMFTRNNFGLWANGTLGTVTAFNDNSIRVKLIKENITKTLFPKKQEVPVQKKI